MVHHAQRVYVRVLGQGLVTALVVINDQLILLLGCFGLVWERTAHLLIDKALQDRLRQNLELQSVSLFSGHASATPDRQMAE